jgi:uncharacterized protein (DUF305 family)
MKNTFFILASFLVISLIACNKDDALEHDDHDDNAMMTIMHQSMMYMDTVPETNDPEIDFPSMMIVHHQGAINMANLELQKGKSDELKQMAQKIITSQQQEIQQFKTYLASHSANNSVPAFIMEHMEAMKVMNKTADIQHFTGDIDNDFATLMIPHHQSAIDNANSYLKYGNDEELMAMAKKMIEDQQKEIQELADWLVVNKR